MMGKSLARLYDHCWMYGSAFGIDVTQRMNDPYFVLQGSNCFDSEMFHRITAFDITLRLLNRKQTI
jgi:hypothetical protein